MRTLIRDPFIADFDGHTICQNMSIRSFKTHNVLVSSPLFVVDSLHIYFFYAVTVCLVSSRKKELNGGMDFPNFYMY